MELHFIFHDFQQAVPNKSYRAEIYIKNAAAIETKYCSRSCRRRRCRCRVLLGVFASDATTVFPLSTQGENSIIA